MAMLQTQRERFLMGLTALAVVLGGGYLFVFRPLVDQYRSLDSRIADLKSDLEKTKEQNVRSQLYRAEFERIKASLSIEGTAQDKKNSIREELTKLLNVCGITAGKQDENPEEWLDDDFKAYSFSLKAINTDWPTLAAFLYQVENNPSVLEIKSLSVQRKLGAGVTSGNAIQANVDISRTIESKRQTKESKKKK
jgi:Tfp pilus assembly protein PilO